MTNNFVAFDVETANPSRSSVCSIGLVKFIDGQEVDSFYTLINPEEEFSSRNTRIHGIKAEDVQESPIFPDVRQQIIDFIDGLPMVAHSARFDAYVLKDVYLKYGLDFDFMEYFCSYQLSKEFLPELPNQKLKTVSEYFEIPLEHHNALSDARACGYILLKLMNQEGTNELEKLLAWAGYSDFGVIGQYGFTKERRQRNSQESYNYIAPEPQEKEPLNLERLLRLILGDTKKHR